MWISLWYLSFFSEKNNLIIYLFTVQETITLAYYCMKDMVYDFCINDLNMSVEFGSTSKC